MSDVTRILSAIERGEAKATDELLPLVYENLRLLAAQKLSHEQPGQTLQATALVHEAYIRLVGDLPESWETRGHFFAAASEAMRRILVDAARRKGSQKRGAGCQRISLDECEIPCTEVPEDLLRLDEALTKLTEHVPAVAEVVKLHYFGGLTFQQIAQIKGISRRTVGRHWNFARLWLYREVTADDLPET